MDLAFDRKLAIPYRSFSQQARVLTEAWVNENIYCPNCGWRKIKRYKNNQPVADFFCANCGEDYELKSKKAGFGPKIVDGAYDAMMRRLQGSRNPNLFLMSHDPRGVSNFLVIPKHFFVPAIIEKRKPLAPTAERADWVGCNILLRDLPESGKIYFVKNKTIESKNAVLSRWKKTLFLRKEALSVKGWTLDVMKCLEKIKKETFSLGEVYEFEKELGRKHPENRHVRDKIRQQLQILRDRGYLGFSNNKGIYRLR